MKFKQFLLEGVKEDIIVILNDMSESELQEFGEWVYSELYQYDGDSDSMDESAGEGITKEEIIELLGEMSAEELEYVRDQLGYDEDEVDLDSHDHENDNIGEDLDEAMSRRLKSKDRNKKKRKFMGNSKADMRRSKVSRKKEARKNRAKTKKKTRINRVKKKAYSASRNKAIASGKHKVKLRRKA